MNRVREMLGRPSAWLGLIGAALFTVALVWAVSVRLMPSTASGCPRVTPSGPSDGMRILGIGSPEIEPRGSLCLVIDNVVREATMRTGAAAVATARADLVLADQALAVAEAPPRTYFWRNRRYTPPPAPGAAERRTAARAARTAAAAKLAAAQAQLAQLTADRQLALFLNGERAPVPPVLVRGTPGPQTVAFTLEPDPAAAIDPGAYWRGLTARRSENGLVPVTLGIAEAGRPAPAAILRATPTRNGGTSQRLGLRAYRPAILWLAGAGLALMLVGLAGLARASGLLRDGRSRYSRYSLGRVQMAWWFGVTAAGFVFIWLVTGDYQGVVGSATFVLLGIAGATAGAARMIDQPKTTPEPLSGGFLADISGGERVELHRLQMILWTVVLGGIYVWNVLVNFTLTEFDTNLLSLAAVVNAVYVGLKTQES
ncbi:MAG: hypothetical protein JWM75_767 [Sphingomonas bacterium]|nr:hypothetical protein [Sphingomonas bacterium]